MADSKELAKANAALRVGAKFRHANGVAMYTGSKRTSYIDGRAEELHATFVFKVPSDVLHIPHRSLQLVTPVASTVQLTRMETIPYEVSDEELLGELAG